MIETLSLEDRRHVRTSRIASLAVVFTFLVCPLAWAGVNPPAAERAIPAGSAATARTRRLAAAARRRVSSRTERPRPLQGGGGRIFVGSGSPSPRWNASTRATSVFTAAGNVRSSWPDGSRTTCSVVPDARSSPVGVRRIS